METNVLRTLWPQPVTAILVNSEGTETRMEIEVLPYWTFAHLSRAVHPVIPMEQQIWVHPRVSYFAETKLDRHECSSYDEQDALNCDVNPRTLLITAAELKRSCRLTVVVRERKKTRRFAGGVGELRFVF